MKKIYLTLLYFVFFIPCCIYYKLFKKPIFIENSLGLPEYGDKDNKVVLMLNESKRYRSSILIKLLETIVSYRVKSE